VRWYVTDACLFMCDFHSLLWHCWLGAGRVSGLFRQSRRFTFGCPGRSWIGLKTHNSGKKTKSRLIKQRWQSVFVCIWCYCERRVKNAILIVFLSLYKFLCLCDWRLKWLYGTLRRLRCTRSWFSTATASRLYRSRTTTSTSSHLVVRTTPGAGNVIVLYTRLLSNLRPAVGFSLAGWPAKAKGNVNVLLA